MSISFLLSRIKSALSFSLFFLTVFCSAVLLSQKESPARPLSIALILENGASDHGAADMLRDALRAAAAKHGASAEVVIADPDKTNQTDIFRKAASDHDLVIVAEGRLHEILRDNAAAFPKTMFGCIDTGVRNRNIMSVTFEDNEPAYIAGAAAAKLLAPGTKIGWLQAEKTPMLNNMYKAFVDGTQLTSPGTKTLQVSAGFNKPLAEADALRSLEEKGCGIVVVAGGYGQRGVWNAAGTTRALLVGMDQDQSSQAPGRVPFSIIKRFDRALTEIVDSAASGHFRAKDIHVYGGAKIARPRVIIPVFPGTNCDYDTAKAFRAAGAEVRTSVLCNIAGDDVLRSIAEMKEHIRRCHIFVLSGGFSSGDEPDGSAKFIVNVLNNKDIRRIPMHSR